MSIEITEETTVDELAAESRAELNELAERLEIEEPDKVKNRVQLATRILSTIDELEDDDEDDDDEEMKSDPKYSDVRRWKVLSTIQYLDQRGKRKTVMPAKPKREPVIIKDIPNATAQDLFRRGCLEPVLR